MALIRQLDGCGGLVVAVGHNKILMKLLKTALIAVFFGSLYTIFRKYQSLVDLAPQSDAFNQPLLQSFIIFVGMSSIACFRPCLKPAEKQTELPSDSMALYFLPSLLDVLGTIIDTAGLYYTSVSISQMLKGSVIFFTYLITIFYLRRRLPLKKHLYMAAILLCLTAIGVCNVTAPSPNKFESNPLLGNILIIVSQLLFSLMFIYQEQILKRYEVRVENAVFWEGIWGVLISGTALAIFSATETPLNAQVVKSCVLICSNPQLLLAILLTALCIGPFNYFGISITKDGSALQRCVICTIRMIVVWTVSLVLGWEEFRLTQLVGYGIMTYCVLMFNQEDGKEAVQNAEMNAEEEAQLKAAEGKCQT